MFELLNRSLRFLGYRNLDALDILIIAILLAFSIPLLLTILVAIASRLGKPLETLLYRGFVAVLFGIILLPTTKSLFAVLPGMEIVLLTILLGCVFSWTLRFYPIRLFLTFLSPVILLFPIMFLFFSPATDIVFSRKDIPQHLAKGTSQTPIVFILFDEFPVNSLLDKSGNIDSVRFPSFAYLQQNATWFKNTYTVADSTFRAVPAILTGSYPMKNNLKMPIFKNYPNNLFTLLAGTHQYDVHETMTQLCPTSLQKRKSPYKNRLQRLFALLDYDVRRPFQAQVLPNDVHDNFYQFIWQDHSRNNLIKAKNVEIEGPKAISASTNKGTAVQQGIKDLLSIRVPEGDASIEDRYTGALQFINGIHKTKKPTLHYAHIMLPHQPFFYLPSGKYYNDYFDLGIGLPNMSKEETERHNETMYQRHLLQLGCADTILGKLIHHLKEEGIYDSALLVVIADHGITFKNDDSKFRLVNTDNYPDILPIPLFIKAPGQTQGQTNDRNIQSIDVLPTIADILHLQLTWPIDGHSAFDPKAPPLKQHLVYPTIKDGHPRIFPLNPEGRRQSLQTKLALFGDETPWIQIANPLNRYVGEPISALSPQKAKDAVILLSDEGQYHHLDLSSRYLPARIKGNIMFSHPLQQQQPLTLAVALNGSIQAITQTYRLNDKAVRFTVMVPEKAFQQDENKVEVFMQGSDKRFYQVPAATQGT